MLEDQADKPIDEWKTRKTLIERARDPNGAEAWKEFYGYYHSFIRMLLCKLQVREGDVEDLSQDVMVRLWKNLPTMELGRDEAKFRTWLGTVIRNVVYTHCTQAASRKRRERNSACPDVVPPDLDGIIDNEWRQHIIDLVLRRLESCFSGKAMQVFAMTLDEKSVDEISRALGVTRDSVYVLRNRVKTRFQKETRQLRNQLEFRQ